MYIYIWGRCIKFTCFIYFPIELFWRCGIFCSSFQYFKIYNVTKLKKGNVLRHFYLKCMYQARKVSSHVNVWQCIDFTSDSQCYHYNFALFRHLFFILFILSMYNSLAKETEYKNHCQKALVMHWMMYDLSVTRTTQSLASTPRETQ